MVIRAGGGSVIVVATHKTVFYGDVPQAEAAEVNLAFRLQK